ncbi:MULTISPECIES: hypothetical protein [Chryseobacterium]|uniref:DUF4848 domain-containing protein n=1 Tax=Chryseobacterium camelliae TaxID=1265445 RepID=A0ABU0TFU4_9FLAO|nr:MULTISPECIES: hypothetical protein [Chryseobacterium]MDT3406361.1 hypothetical protein [Pseudacidovorax intermedius]MDQ1095841.1 hypothetical protein [Chryseobacterium camelliae]MDQ1099777.1 hypothetical protein [Chryseobacterium sp. SORGH_AS_1048]MDR6087124.1 hypothetical protein [Chryseobacterium sp. SORGH_AS_0909]MDR6131497.1 hypothetical protein [Chryseobacterium sp. SORGH_AS_1175]
MKKTSLMNAVFALMTGLFLYSCQQNLEDPAKENPQNTAKSSMKAAPDPNKMLKFASLDEYDNFLSDADFRNDKIANTDYSSLRSSLDEFDARFKSADTVDIDQDPAINDTIYEDFELLPLILNRDKLVQMGDYIVRVDVPAEKAYAVDAGNANAVHILLNDPANSAVKPFSTKEEMIGYLFHLVLCKDRWALYKNITTNTYCSSRKRTRKMLAYQHAGIYFEVKAEARAQKKWLIWWNDYSQYPTIPYVSYTLTQRCGYTQSWSGNPLNFGPDYIHNGNRASFTIYKHWKALKSYNVKATIGGCWGNQTFQIQD